MLRKGKKLNVVGEFFLRPEILSDGEVETLDSWSKLGNSESKKWTLYMSGHFPSHIYSRRTWGDFPLLY